MDQQWRPAKRNSGQSFKKGRGSLEHNSPRVISDSTAAEDLAEYILTVLARDPNSIQINREVYDGGRARLKVSCDPTVTGRLIGKDGRTITALRQLVRAVANRHGKRVDIEITMPDQE